ncbi:MAG: Biotin transport ATP-binding protein BioM [Candidatus Erwinia impunctatus]|nr:Biotin transport ATP-binding protein BioM [Culicoides impunctatus]
MFKFIDVAVEKEDRTLLSNITVTLNEPRIGIIGLNGSGKSTFARLLNGLELPTSGTLRYQGSEEVKKRRREVGFVFQNPENQIVYPGVREDLEFGLKNLRLSAAEIRQRIEAIAVRLGIEHLLERFTHQLSGGEQQMIALAGVVVMEPEVIVFDEPTTLLDLKNKRQLLDAINQLSQQVVMISHDLDTLSQFSRVLQIENGTIKRDGPPAEVIRCYHEEYA